MRDEYTKKAIRVFRNKINWASSFRKNDVTISAVDALAISDELWRLDEIAQEGNEFSAPRSIEENHE